jgi:hypothetical protein
MLPVAPRRTRVRPGVRPTGQGEKQCQWDRFRCSVRESSTMPMGLSTIYQYREKDQKNGATK